MCIRDRRERERERERVRENLSDTALVLPVTMSAVSLAVQTSILHTQLTYRRAIQTYFMFTTSVNQSATCTEQARGRVCMSELGSVGYLRLLQRSEIVYCTVLCIIIVTYIYRYRLWLVLLFCRRKGNKLFSSRTELIRSDLVQIVDDLVYMLRAE